MKDQILKALREGADSFVNLSNCVPGFDGDAVASFNSLNIIIWAGLSQEAVDSLNTLLKEKRIKFVPTLPLVYLIDGKIPNFPVAKTARKYKKPHWLPVVIKIIE